MIRFLLLFSCLFWSWFSWAQSVDSSNSKKKYFTKKASGHITIDGLFTEEVWKDVEWGGDFIQWQPDEGKAPSQQTAFKILYDEKFLYLAFRCFDSSPDSIDKRMGRRDEFPGDWIEINLDSYHDLRTAFSFTLSVSGVRSDEFVSNDGSNWDGSWNPIWFAKTHVDDKGWTGEVKIPFSQLRYGAEKEKVWGLQVNRRLFRKEERSTWQYIPQNSGVWVSRFGELHGL
ncbi:MAG TPA: carbohydrate binding family 9 domain-containing protein, partial [Chitinophagaceae bacterium]|nr:carbohydrate binding family 9 domain-containing protein [Chitinophagaceae bacterium]